MKNQYVKPMATVEGLVANEFVAICCNLACSLGANNPDKYGSGVHTKITKDHTQWGYTWKVGQGCGWPENQVFRGSKATGYNIYELNAPNASGELKCTFTSPSVSNFTEEQINKWATDGTVLYWETTSLGTTYKHQGVLSPQDSKHPNRS